MGAKCSKIYAAQLFVQNRVWSPRYHISCELTRWCRIACIIFYFHLLQSFCVVIKKEHEIWREINPLLHYLCQIISFWYLNCQDRTPTSEMVSAEHQTGLFISIPIYFVVLACCAWWAHRRMERMEHDKTADKLSAHYLGGRQFGQLMTAGTTFASLFSGYTVIGVPNEAYKSGWSALRWMSTVWGECILIIWYPLVKISFFWMIFIFSFCKPNQVIVWVWGYFGTGLRLRKASNIRNHQSPVDFITDRFQSQLLRYKLYSFKLYLLLSTWVPKSVQSRYAHYIIQ